MASSWELDIDEVDADGRVRFHFNDELLFGAYSTSRRFLVGTRHADDDVDGFSGGLVVLLDLLERAQRFEARLVRPWAAHVSDDGLVVVEDWGDSPTVQAGELVAFDSAGHRVWAKRYRAGLYESAMSRNGTLVLVSTCNSDFEPHCGKTWLLDSANGAELWEHDGWGQGGHGLWFRGDRVVMKATGEPLERWVLRETKDALHREDEDELEELLNMLQGVLVLPGVSSRARALSWRYLGDAALLQGDRMQAFRCWSRAIELDPGVGLARKFAALAKELAGA